MYVDGFCGNLWYHDSRDKGELDGKFGDLMYDGAPAAGTPVYASDTEDVYWNYIRRTGRITVRADDTLCLTYDSGDAVDPIKLAVCDDSPQQFWSVHFESPLAMPCAFMGGADTCVRGPGTCPACPECSQCLAGECEDFADPDGLYDDPCCGCDLATSYCFGVEEPENDTCLLCAPADNTCPGSTLKNYHCFPSGGQCRDDACGDLYCGVGTGCYTWESINQHNDSIGPFEPTCTPDPCQNFECYSPNAECVLVGAPGGDQIPWCQCKENYISFCIGTFMFARANHIYKRHLLDNIYFIDRMSCAFACMVKRKCQYYSYHSGRDGHCKLYSRFGQTVLKQRKGWMASSPLFHPANVRAGGDDCPLDVPPDFMVPSGDMFAYPNAETFFKYNTVAMMSPDTIRQTAGGADLNAAFSGAEWKSAFSGEEWKSAFSGAELDKAISRAADLKASFSGADWKAALSGTQHVGSFSFKGHGDLSGKKLLDTKSVNIADMMQEVIPEDVEDMPIKGSCAPKDEVKGCGRGDEHCYCTPDCEEFHDCCPDYYKYCGA